MVDPGLLRFLAEFLSLEEYGTAQRQLLRGVFDLEQMRALPLPQTEDDFVALVSDAHATLFKHVAGLTFVGGRYRCEHDPVSFGGDGRHEQEGAPHDKIEERLRQGFRVATAQGEGWDHISRSANFLAHFFRVHPFLDGNGRVGRFIVEKICRASGKSIQKWGTTGEARREYIAALEEAHRRHRRHPRESVRRLENWILVHTEDVIGTDELDVT